MRSHVYEAQGLSYTSRVDSKVEGEIQETEQNPANAEAHDKATSILRELQDQGHHLQSHLRHKSDASLDPGAEACDQGDAVPTGSSGDAIGERTPLAASSLDIEMEATTTDNAKTALGGKPLVDAPEFGDRVRDTDQQAHWIPGTFPTIFQNQHGDLHNYVLKQPEMSSWGPHIMRSWGWHAQAHTTFCYWWLNMLQRYHALSAKKW